MLGFIAWVKDWIASRELARSTSAATHRGAAPEVLSRLDKAKADFEAAVKLWPRNRTAINETWLRLRDAKCAQLSGEIGR